MKASGFLLLFSSAVLIGAEPGIGNAPVKDFALKRFTKAGPLDLVLRGTEASYPSADRIDIIDLNLTRFSGDASQHIEDILLSEAATFLPKDNLVLGEKTVRVIRDDMEMTGEKWSYDNLQKKVSIGKNVRVVFKTKLADILK
jgi:hypothetical protein